jgi:ABC-type lipoprotein release transport system permease subunit
LIVSWGTCGLSLLVLTGIGVVAATYPAARAAQLPPVEALRFDL